jgi:aspartate racemase
MIGGMSWESSAIYYRLVNEAVKERLGGHHSAETVMYSVDFALIKRLQHEDRWEEAAAYLAEVARKVEQGGADFVVLCTNTMHRVADAIAQAVSIPMLHIADATAEAVKARGIRTVGLLATRFTMEQDFYTGRLTREHGIEVIVPDEEERQTVHAVIYNELCLGEVKASSRQAYRRIMSRLVERGAEAVILGCTEITMLVGQEDASVPLFDTTRIHADKAVAMALDAKDLAADEGGRYAQGSVTVRSGHADAGHPAPSTSLRRHGAAPADWSHDHD